jgi:acyl-coenzyme A synthetase/AMP-(fatty) acid ligase
VPTPGTKINLVTLKIWMIANYEKNICPKKFYIVNDLPTTETGKIEKYKLTASKILS